MKKILILGVLALAAGSTAAMAQDLNPTVEVTNTYTQSASGIDKPAQTVAVPDSVVRFNLDFDYDVITTPYRGSYEFRPYLVQLRPLARPSAENTLYVKAGAGYSLHPELTAVWTPLRGENYRVNLYANHSSYIGLFRTITDQGGWLKDSGARTSGYRLNTDAGVNGFLSYGSGSVFADISYLNLTARDDWDARGHNGVNALARVKASDDFAPFYYDIAADYRFLSCNALKENRILLHGELGTPLGESLLRLGYKLETFTYSGGDYVGQLEVVPRYVFSIGDLSVDAGVKFASIINSPTSFHPKKSGLIFPEVKLSYTLVDDVLVFQSAVTGGNRLNSYGDMLMDNIFLAGFAGTADNSVERITATLGIRGKLFGRLSYNLNGGYTRWENGLLWGVITAPALAPIFDFADYNMFFADAELSFSNEWLDAGGRLVWRWTDLKENFLFAPEMIHGNFRALYNWGGRIKAGVDLEGVTARKAATVSMPGYLDLGLYGEYGLDRNVSAWLRVGNILNQTIQKYPLHAEQGIYFTAGILLHF